MADIHKLRWLAAELEKGHCVGMTKQGGKDQSEKQFHIPMERQDPNTYQHPPFEGELRSQIEAIQTAFADACADGYEVWEDAFRRDRHREREIQLWLQMAEAYLHFKDEHAHASRLERAEAYRVLVAWSVEGLNLKRIMERAGVRRLSRRQVEALVTQVMGGTPPPFQQ
jgi:hypothetical protein